MSLAGRANGDSIVPVGLPNRIEIIDERGSCAVPSKPITGAVKGPSRGGGPDGGAHRNAVATGNILEVIVNQEGAYAFPALPTGPYQLTAQAAGLKRLGRPGSKCGFRDLGHRSPTRSFALHSIPAANFGLTRTKRILLSR